MPASDAIPYSTSIDPLTHSLQRTPLDAPDDIFMDREFGTLNDVESAFQSLDGNEGLYPVTPYQEMAEGASTRIRERVDAKLSLVPGLQSNDWKIEGSRQFGQAGYPICMGYTLRNRKSNQSMLLMMDRQKYETPATTIEGSPIEVAESLGQITAEIAGRKHADRDTKLHIAVRNRRDNEAKALLARFPELQEKQNDSGQTPFQLAAWTGSFEMLKALGGNERVVRIKDYEGNNAMHSLGFGSQLRAGDQGDKLNWLLGKYPEMANETNEFKSTPLHVVALSGRKDLVERLYKANPSSLTVRDVDGDTPVHLFAMKQRKIIPMNAGGTKMCIIDPVTGSESIDKDSDAPFVFDQSADTMRVTDNAGLTPAQLLEQNGTIEASRRLASKYVRTEPPKLKLSTQNDRPASDVGSARPSDRRSARSRADAEAKGSNWIMMAVAGVVVAMTIAWGVFAKGGNRLWGVVVGAIATAACLFAPKLLGAEEALKSPSSSVNTEEHRSANSNRVVAANLFYALKQYASGYQPDCKQADDSEGRNGNAPLGVSKICPRRAGRA